MRFAHTKWQTKRFIHPVEIISKVLSVCYLIIILLTFYEVIGYTIGFFALVIVILIKVPLYIRRNTLLV
jgi:hypothetical protein